MKLMPGAVSRNLSKLKHCELPPKKVKQKFYPSKHKNNTEITENIKKHGWANFEEDYKAVL